MSGSRTLKIELLGDAKDAARAFDDIGKKSDGLTDKLGGLGGALAGAALTGHIEDSTVSLGELRAQLGLTEEETKELGAVARDVYTDNFGASIGEATQVTGLLHQALGTTGDELKNATEDVFRITDAFGHLGADSQIVAEDVRVMKQAFPDKSDAEILDIIAMGFQEGAGRSGDLQDTLQEYPRFFSEIGLSAEDMTNFLVSGMEAGARNSDLLGDAVKEMGIIIQEEGSKGQERIAKIFGDEQAQQLITNFAEGGEAGREAFFTILEGLNEIEDPLERNQAAVDLFGTKGEDLAGVLDGMLPSFIATKDQMNEVGDVTGSLDAQYVGMGSTLEGLKRKFESNLIGPLGGVAAPAQEAVTAFGGVATGLAGLSALGVDVGGVVSDLGGKLAGAVKPTQLMSGAQAALNVVMSANPVLLVVLALAALTAGLIIAYKESETFRNIVNGVWESIQETVMPVLDWFRDTFIPFFTETIPAKFREFREMSVGEILSLAGDMLREAPGVVANLVTGLANLLSEGAGGAFGLWVSLNTRVLELLGSLGGWLLTEGGPQLVSKLVSGLQQLFSMDTAAGAVGQFLKLQEMVNTQVSAIAGWLLTEGGPLVVGKLIEGLSNLFSVDTAVGAVGQFNRLQTEIAGVVGGITTSALGWGADVAGNFVSGLISILTSSETWSNLYNSAFDLAKNMVKGAYDAIVPGSPSKEGRKIGQYFYQGLILGMEDGTNLVHISGRDLGRAAIEGTSEGMDEGAQSVGALPARAEPKPVGQAMGRNYGQGVAEGVEHTSKDGYEAGTRVGGAIAKGTDDGYEGYGVGFWNGNWVAPPESYEDYYNWGWGLGESAAKGAEEGFGYEWDGWGWEAPPDGGSDGPTNTDSSNPPSTDSPGSQDSGGGGGSPVGFTNSPTHGPYGPVMWSADAGTPSSGGPWTPIYTGGKYAGAVAGASVPKLTGSWGSSYSGWYTFENTGASFNSTSSGVGASSGAISGGGIGGSNQPINLTVMVGNDQLVSTMLDTALPGMSLSVGG